jgi:hypothetical protein
MDDFLMSEALESVEYTKRHLVRLMDSILDDIAFWLEDSECPPREVDAYKYRRDKYKKLKKKIDSFDLE